MASGRGWLAGDWPSTGDVLNITAAAWTTGFQWWRSGDITRTQNFSECILVLGLCVVVFALTAVPKFVSLTLLGKSPATGGPPSVTPRHLALSSTADSSTPPGPLTGNRVLDRENISAPQAVDVRRLSYIRYVIGTIEARLSLRSLVTH